MSKHAPPHQLTSPFIAEQTEPRRRAAPPGGPADRDAEAPSRGLRRHGGVPRPGLEGHQLPPRVEKGDPRPERPVPHQSRRVLPEDGRAGGLVHGQSGADRDRSRQELPQHDTRLEEGAVGVADGGPPSGQHALGEAEGTWGRRHTRFATRSNPKFCKSR
jgi:hypothetical protein